MAALVSLFGIVDVRPGWAQEGIVRAVVVQQYRVGTIKLGGDKVLPTERVRQVLGLVSGEVFDELETARTVIRVAFTQSPNRRLRLFPGHVNSRDREALEFTNRALEVGIKNRARTLHHRVDATLLRSQSR